MTPTFQGEVQFRRYSDTSTQGQQIVLALSDRDALESFIGKEGKRFMAVLVEVGDDEQPVEPLKLAPKPRKDQRGPLCREACDLCAMPEFWEWLSAYGNPANCESHARGHVLTLCGIESRKELDTDRDAAAYFIREFRVPFIHWQQQRRKAA